MQERKKEKKILWIRKMNSLQGIEFWSVKTHYWKDRKTKQSTKSNYISRLLPGTKLNYILEYVPK